MEKIIAIDIGNSFVKIKYNDKIHYIFADELIIDNIKKIINLAEINNAIVSSVDVEMECKIINFLAENNITVYLADNLLKRQNIIDFSNVKGMGNDRKLGLLGAAKLFDAPIITIDCGTAITINVLNKDNICLGGIIMCGIGTHAKALEHYTSCLPKIKLDFNTKEEINNTDSAINTGIITAVRGGVIDFFSHTIYKNKLKNVNVIITGGYGQNVLRLCKAKLRRLHMQHGYKNIRQIKLEDGLIHYGLEKLIEMEIN